MAKKSSKKQSKQPNTDNSATEPAVNIPLTEEPTTTATNKNTVPPAASPPVSVSSPSPMLPITDAVSIERLVSLAKDSTPDSALGIVWKHAYEEGYQNGRLALLQNLEKKLDEKYKEGEKEGINKGKEKYYGKGIVKGESEEYKRWMTAGHSGHCFKPTAILGDASIQTDPLSITTMSISTQTDSAATNTTVSVQTNPISTQAICHITRHPSSLPTSVPTTPSVSMTTIDTQTEATTSQHLEIGSPTHVATSQSPTPSRNGKNSKIHCTSEISPKITVFPSNSSSIIAPNSPAPSSTTTAPGTRSTTNISTQNHQNTEILPISTQKTSIFVGNANDASNSPHPIRIDHPTHPNPENMPSSSVDMSPSSATAGLEISAGFGGRLENSSWGTASDIVATEEIVLGLETATGTAGFTQKCEIFEKSCNFTSTYPLPTPTLVDTSPSPALTSTSCPASTSIRTVLKSHPESAGFVEKHQNAKYHPKIEKSPVPACFNWADDANAFPITPTFPQHPPPRDLSDLRSSTFNPFSSLQRRRRQSRNPRRFIRLHHQHNCYHPFPTFHTPHNTSRANHSVFLDWDQDPRLADLSNALRALGWVRR